MIDQKHIDIMNEFSYDMFQKIVIIFEYQNLTIPNQDTKKYKHLRRLVFEYYFINKLSLILIPNKKTDLTCILMVPSHGPEPRTY